MKCFAPVFWYHVEYKIVLYHLTEEFKGCHSQSITQPRSQHCLSTALAQAVSISTLTGCNLNDESVRKVLKTQLRHEICNGLQLQSTKVHTTLGQLNV